MPAVSQALGEFANHHRQPAGPGAERIDTPRYQITLQPDFPIPGPNNVSWIRCLPDEADDVIREARATIAPRHLPVMWMLDPETEPPDFAEHLARHDVHPDPNGGDVAGMVLPIDAQRESPSIKGLEIRDALVDRATFRNAAAVAAEAFNDRSHGDDPEFIAMEERRRLTFRAAGNRHLLLAMIDDEPAGSAGISLFPPAGA